MTTTQTPAIAARIADLIAAGWSVPDAWDAVLGEGSYRALAGAVYDRLAVISRRQVVALRAEAGEHGDLGIVAVCDRALDGDTAAWIECEAAIRAARAMEDA